jgi:D-alanyl-D-alanine carboxypeptidase/D-alanyl-D-alanine-endopeptidase (penicillin-binding protein 4)
MRIWIGILAASQLSAQPFADLLSAWKSDPTLAHAAYGFCVMDAKTGSVVAAHNSDLSLIPASSLKVVTTAAALALRGPEYRYLTRLMYTGQFDRITGVLDGDLVIIGSGDPTLESEHVAQPGKSVIDDWAASVANAGVKEVRGTVIGDGSALERAIPDHWIWSDIGNYFGAVPNGLSYRDNKYTLVFRTASTGSAATLIAVTSGTNNLSFPISTTVTAMGAEDAAYVYGDPFSNSREVRGTIPARKERFEIEAALADPALLCAQDLADALTRKGIRVSGAAISSYTPSARNGTLLHEHQSPMLSDIIRVTNLKSINHYCESVVQSLGTGAQSDGLRKVKRYWAQQGFDTTALFLADASGLSRADNITPAFQSAALCAIYRDRNLYPHLDASLSVAGKEGVLRNIGKGTSVEGRLRAKTGYIQRARSHCGYVRSASGRELAFSVILNNYACTPREARLKLEAFLLALANL